MLNEILGAAARFNQLLTRKFNIVGGAPAPQLTPEIGCDLSLDPGPEGRILANELLAYGYIDVTGAAGQRAAVMLRNPTGSNLVFVVERIAAQTVAAAQDIVVGIIKTGAAFPQLPAAGDVGCRDTRVVTNGGNYTRPPSGNVTASTNTPAAVVQANIARLQIQTYGQEFQISAPIAVLAPGWSIQMESGTVTSQFRAWLFWREVPLCPGEVGPF